MSANQPMSRSGISDRMLRDLSHLERADLLRRIAWTGFDIVLLGCLAITAWGLWKHRQIVVPASMITSVLLLCDAWFDVFTANGHHDLMVSSASALFAELPLATLLCMLCVRALRVGARAARGLEPNAPIVPLWRAPLIAVPGPPQDAPLEPGDPSPR